MRVLVCGSRDHVPYALIAARLHPLPDGTVVMHGAARGVDTIAGEIAHSRGLVVEAHPADWHTYGKRAGTKRNLDMLDAKPDLVIAFWDGKSPGTAHTIRHAEKRGIPVEVHKPRIAEQPEQLAREETRADAVQARQDEEPLQDQREMEVEDVRGGGDGGEQLHGPPRLPVPRVRPLARHEQAIDHVPLPYPSLSVDEIAALPVAELSDTDARLFLWTTMRYLPAALTIINGWGLTYAQTLVWDKTPFFNPLGGSIAPNACEFLLVATRGHPPRTGRWPTSVIRARKARSKHSRKPDVFLDVVESVSPGPYLEMFARRQRLGWDTWGDECLNHVEMESA